MNKHTKIQFNVIVIFMTFLFLGSCSESEDTYRAEHAKNIADISNLFEIDPSEVEVTETNYVLMGKLYIPIVEIAKYIPEAPQINESKKK